MNIEQLTLEDDQDEESASAGWRRLALQFDGHRMEAIWHLKSLIENPEGHREAAIKFTKAGPLSGSEVLDARIQALFDKGKKE